MSDIRPGSTNYFHLGGKIDPITEIVNAGILTTGKVFWVKDIDDEDYLEFKDRVGRHYCYTDIQSAIDECTDDQNDYVMVCPKNGGSAWESGTTLDMNKDKVHLIGVGYNPNTCDYGVTIQGFATAGEGSSHYGLMHITGDGVEVSGICFKATAGTTTTAGGGIGQEGSLNSDSGGIISVYGQAPYIHDCDVVWQGTDWVTGTPDSNVLVGSAMHDGRIDNCRINSGTQTADGTCIGVNLRMNNERWKITNTDFYLNATNVEEGAVKLSPGTALGGGEALHMEDCSFMNLNSATACNEMVSGTAMVNSFGYMKNCSGVHVTAAHSSDALVLITPTFGGGTINNLLQNPGLAIPGTALIVTKT